MSGGGRRASSRNATVLAVDDLPEYLDLYEVILGERYDLRTARDGESALEALDEDVDVVLLDRNMPEVSGDDVLERIRDAGYDCRVAMVSAVEPSVDVLEMGFDTYLVKPVSGDHLVETVERLLRRARYDDGLQELYALCSKRALLRAHDERERDAIAELERRIEERRKSLDHVAQHFSADDFRATFHDIPDA